jgi:hypothetical protein
MSIKVNTLEKSVVYYVDARPAYRSGFEWWWGGARTAWRPYTYGQPVDVHVTSNLQQVREKQSEVVAGSAPERDQIWRMIHDERAAMRRQMIGKYGDAFAE